MLIVASLGLVINLISMKILMSSAAESLNMKGAYLEVLSDALGSVGVIIGAAFGKIVESIVKDIFMPIVNFLMGGAMDFSNKFLVLSKPESFTGPETYAELTKAGATVFAWGNFRLS